MTEIRVALVTGAARGLGLAIARGLAEAGHHCILADRNSEVRDAARAIVGPLGACDALVVDMANADKIGGLVSDVIAWRGRLDILVNNAGINPRKPDKQIYRFEEIPLAQWNEVLAVNLTAAFTLCQQAVPHMRARHWGRIINISSRTARTHTGTAAAHYAASKSGMLGLTRQIAGEVGPDGITANCIAPGPIDSPMSAADGGRMNEIRAASAPLRRIGRPEEIGATAAFLASEGAGYITGAIIDLNGGSFMP